MGNLSKRLNSFCDNLADRIEDATQEVLIEAAESTIAAIQDYLDRNWYNDYTPKSYERTYEIRDLIHYTIKNNYIYIRYDTRKFHTARSFTYGKHGGYTQWTPHRGFDGERFVGALIEWVDQGGDGGSIHNPRRDDGGIDYLEYGREYLEDYINYIAKSKIKYKIRQKYTGE